MLILELGGRRLAGPLTAGQTSDFCADTPGVSIVLGRWALNLDRVQASLEELARQAVDHRVWRGQAAVLLPMIDQIRIALSELLTRRDPSWPEYRDKREARFGGGDGKTAAELWTIESFLEGHTFDPGLRRLGPTVEAIRLIRNSLAHYRPVEWAGFEQVCKIYTSMRR